jgi:hypothetical protein
MYKPHTEKKKKERKKRRRKEFSQKSEGTVVSID